jgi:hypothetical protein
MQKKNLFKAVYLIIAILISVSAQAQPKHVFSHNLGRYWNVGPQHSLYCPASWLKKGENEMVVFDLLQEAAPDVSGGRELK